MTRDPHTPAPAYLLEVSGVRKAFGPVVALKNAEFCLRRGSIHALCGGNGAGKSTFLSILMGFIQPDGGDIFINGQRCEFHHPREALNAGIAIVQQELSAIPDLTVAENIWLGREPRRLGFVDFATLNQRTTSLLKELDFKIDAREKMRNLSVAEQQLVEIAKALSLEARVLVLDEPTATLTPGEAEHLFSVMNDLRLLGVGMVFISHHLDEIFTICDRITVLRDGAYIETLATGDTNVEELVRLMVGRKIENAFPVKQHPVDTATVLLEAEIQREKHGATDRFHLHKGEILGFAGLVGSGRTETVSALIGASRCHRKRVSLGGQPAALRSPAQALAQGIGLLPESRKTEGLVLPFSVAQNITLNRHHRRGKIFVSARQDRDVVQRLIRAVGVKTPDAETAVSTLSGGNQQKVVIARWLNNDCNILIFDEPTRGIDVGAKAEIYRLISELANRGVAIILVSSELPEILGMSDRVMVMHGGRITGILDKDDADQEKILALASE